MPRVNPEIIVWARETAGLNLEEAARKLGFRNSSRSTASEKLAEIETGNREPSRPQLLRMSDQYRRPLLTFYLSKPPKRGERGVDFRTSTQDHAPSTEALLDTLIRDVRARQDMIRAVLEDEDEADPLPFVGSHQRRDGHNAVFASLDKLIGVELSEYRAQPDASAAFDLLRAGAEGAGIFVLLKGDLGNYFTAIETSIFRGFSIADPVAPFVVINDQDARPAWSFTLLHETVHLLLGQTGISGGQYSENETERFCDDIAGEYLLPSADLERLSNGYDPDALTISDQIGLLANELNVSRTMVAYRAYRSSVIKQDTYARLSAIYRQQWRDELERRRSQAQALEGGPNYYTIRRHRLGNRMINLVRRMMAADALSTSKAARILGLKSRQVQSLLGARRSS